METEQTIEIAGLPENREASFCGYSYAPASGPAARQHGPNLPAVAAPAGLSGGIIRRGSPGHWPPASSARDGLLHTASASRLLWRRGLCGPPAGTSAKAGCACSGRSRQAGTLSGNGRPPAVLLVLQVKLPGRHFKRRVGAQRPARLRPRRSPGSADAEIGRPARARRSGPLFRSAGGFAFNACW